jgi:hypothetical protein
MGGGGRLTYERVEVVKVGPEKTGLLFEDDGSHGGSSRILSTLLLPIETGFTVPFDEITAEDNLGMYGEHDKRSFHYTAKIEFIPGNNREYFDLKIVTTGTRIDEKGRRIPWNRKKIYVMQKGVYVLETEQPVASSGQSKK